MEDKKKKLTISGSPKKTIKNFATSNTSRKKTVIIDKQTKKFFGNKSSPGAKKNYPLKPNFGAKTFSSTSDFERRKLAEQRATKRLKGDEENKDRKAKLGTKKREVKLTVSRALSAEI